MAKQPTSAAINRKFAILLDNDLAEAVWKYHAAIGGTSPAETIKELIRSALTSMPEIATVAAARGAAYTEARAWTQRRLAAALEEIAHDLKDR